MPESALSLHRISRALAPFSQGLELSPGHLEKIRVYAELLVSWNRSMNLTAIDDPLEIVARHFGESIFAVNTAIIRRSRLADVGSGAGFPGLPLKIVCPDLDVVLIEPNQKKCAFLNEVKRKLELDAVEVVRCRYEDYPVNTSASLDFVCTRALGNYRRLLRWSRTVLSPTGKVVLWLGEEDSILVGRMADWSWDMPKRIPESSRRFIQTGKQSR